MRVRALAWCAAAALAANFDPGAALASRGSAPPAAAPQPDSAALAAESDGTAATIKLDLPRSSLLSQLEQPGHMPKQAFVPSVQEMTPYIQASLGAPIAFTVAHDNAPLVSAPAIEHECDEIVATLLAHWNGPKPDTKVLVTASTNYGAHVNDAGLILVNIGTFYGDTAVSNRDELALLLAHELSHILMLHPKESGLLTVATTLLRFGGSFYSGYAIFKDSHYSNNTLNVNPDSDMLLRSMGTSAASSSLLLDLLVPGRDRKREIDADELGLDLAWRSGFRVMPIDIDRFTQKNAEDDHQVSQYMETVRSTMVLILARALFKQGNSVTSSVGPVGALLKPLLLLGSDAAAAKIFDSLANARKRHIDPAVRSRLMSEYYDKLVKDQPFDAKTEPVVHRAKGLAGRAQLALSARQEADHLYAGARWARDYEMASLEALGLMLEQEKDQSRRDKPGFFDRIKSGVTKKSGKEDQPEDTAKKNSADGSRTASAEVKPADALAERKAATLKKIAELAATMGHPGNVNPAVAKSSAGAGKLASLWLHQEPRGQLYWTEGQRRGYPIAELYRDLGASLSRTKSAARLPVLVADYRTKTGTVDPILDVAVGAALAQGNVADAEKLAAHCLELSPHQLYPSCAAYLGYNPVDKGGKTKTPEGERAFASARLAVGLKGMLSFGQPDDKQ